MENEKDNIGKEELDRSSNSKTDTNLNQESDIRSVDDQDTDKYLAMEQQGVQYTKDADPNLNSDHANLGSESHKEWNEEGGNSKNSEAFNQDDYMLEDNIDLDEDQNQSISTDDEDFEETNERY